MTKEELLGQLYDETLTGNKPAVLELTNAGLAQGLGPETLLYEALIPSLEEVGARFERGDFFVPEMLIAGKAMAGALEILRPLLAETGAQTIGKIVMGTVKGDVHDIGKNLVNIMFEGAGFEVIDLGVQVAPEKFVAAIQEHKPDIVGFSAFLTTTMPMFKANINALQKSGLRDQVIVMVGGAPVTQEYADVVGADGYAADASAAVVRAKELIAQSTPKQRAQPAGGNEPVHTILSSATKTVRIGDDQPFAIIGERINPTGRKIFQQQLRAGDLSRVEIDVKEQVAGGAMLLDVNMGAPLADEAELMRQAVPLIQGLTDLPLVIDSSIIEVLDAGLAAYQGKALVNSVTAEDERMEAILPIVKKYGAAVIGLPNDEEEIPEEPARRLELVRKLIGTATEKYKIDVEDIVIDPLAMPVGADTLHPSRTIETIAMIKAEFGVNMTLGASNVSFGMPDRHSIAATFLPIAISHGLTSAIMDARAPQIVRAVKAADLVLNRDEWGASWIAAHRAQQAAQKAAEAQAQGAT
jgi:5-methyltetrahydrofolate--homocysteine methyltransferase